MISSQRKLLVDEDKFDPNSCLDEFIQIYKDNKLKSKDLVRRLTICASKPALDTSTHAIVQYIIIKSLSA
jgi:hypothetical protein